MKIDSDTRRRKVIPSEYPWVDYGNRTAPHNIVGELSTETSRSLVLDPFPPEGEIQHALCAAWAILMAQYTGRDDACFGILSPESPDDHETSLGLFHINYDKEMGLADFRSLAKQEFREAFTDRATALEREDQSQVLDVTKMHLRSILDVSFNVPTPAITDIAPSCHPLPHGVPLILRASLEHNSIQLHSQFNHAIIERAEISRVMTHFLELLHKVLSPELQALALGDVDFLGSEDRNQILKWNNHPIGCTTLGLHTLFEDTAGRNKGKCALIYEGKPMTYEELDMAASNLAVQIAQSCESVGEFLPICFERCPEMIIAMIAVLKSNKGFVPIDPCSPKSRRDQIISYTKSQFILVSESCQEHFDANMQTIVVRASSLTTSSSAFGVPINSDCSNGEQPAYVLFTSGSTGIPKGVVVSHSNISTSILELGKQFSLDGHTRMLQFGSYTFDATLLEIFGPLAHGGCVCIPTETERLNNIPVAIEDMKVNTLVVVPTVLRLLYPDEVPTVNKLIVGGEVLTRELIDRWANKAQLIQAYGPTETSICSLANLRVTSENLPSDIGGPIACRPWVVNPTNYLQLMPVGCVGELLIEGPTVARGYLNNPAATELAFTPSLPWAKNDKQLYRGYRTGDLVRYFPNGRLMFVGRTDDQIKLHGHRIEFGEIEFHLRRLKDVQDAFVQLVHTQRSPAVAAFVVERNVLPADGNDQYKILKDTESGLVQLWDSLVEVLPHYMIPKYIIPVNFIPRLLSGKVDRNRLVTVVEESSVGSLDRYQLGYCDKSRDEAVFEGAELLKMRNLWALILDIEPSSISRSDRFLHLGGNSIKAMKLVSVARAHGICLKVQDILKNNCTIPDLCNSIVSEHTPACSQKPQSQEIDEYTATWVQAVSLTLLGTFPEGNYTRIVLDIRGPLDLERLDKAVKRLIERNDILRTIFKVKNGSIQATIQSVSAVPLLKFQSQSEAERHWRSFDMAVFERPLTEISYVVISKDSTLFSIGLHHCQYDAWTMSLLLQQLKMFYVDIDVPSGPSFSEYANRLLDESRINSPAEFFWKEQLANVPMALIGKGDNDDSQADGILNQSIQLSSSASGSEFTFATILYAAWALVLSDYTPRDLGDPSRSHDKIETPIVFGGAVSGRNMAMDGIMEMAGPTINMVPFTVNLARCKTYTEALRSVRAANLSIVPFESMPFFDIVQRCTSWDPSASPGIGSIVQHLDIDIECNNISFSSATASPLNWRFKELVREYGRCRVTDVYILSKLRSTSTKPEALERVDVVDIEMKFNGARVKQKVAENLFQQLHTHIMTSLQNPGHEITKFKVTSSGVSH